MPKITVFGGHTNAGLTEKDGGFTDDTVKTSAKAAKKAAKPEPKEETKPQAEAKTETPAPFDPSGMSVRDVRALLAECTEDERAAVLELERKGQNRAGVTGT